MPLFSLELCKLESSNMLYVCRMSYCIVGLRLRVMAHIFLLLKLGIHMDNELLYCGIENRTPCSYFSLYLSIFLSFMAKFVSQFSPELCMLESSNMVYICRMSDYIVGLRLRVMAHIFLFLSIFLSFPIPVCPLVCGLYSCRLFSVFCCYRRHCYLFCSSMSNRIIYSQFLKYTVANFDVIQSDGRVIYLNALESRLSWF